MVKVSFIIPAFNVRQLVGRCLTTLLPLLREGHELVFVDDGSSDDTLQTVRAFVEAEQLPCAKVLTQSNRGQGAARNRGIAVASGDYIWFVDADDFVDTAEARQVIADCTTAVDGGVTADAVVFGLWLDDGQLSMPSPILRQRSYATGTDYFRESNREGTFRTFPVNKLFRVAKVRELQAAFAEGRIYEDLQFNLEFFVQCGRVLQLPLNPYHYVLGNADSSTNASRIQERDFQALTAAEDATAWLSDRVLVMHDAHAHDGSAAKPVTVGDISFQTLLFSFLSSCLLRKYIPLSYMHPEARAFVERTMHHHLFRKAVRHCATHPSIGLRRWGMALCIWLSPRMSRHIINRMMR